MIDAHALTFAAHGHIQRVNQSIEQTMLDLHVDCEELRALGQELLAQRTLPEIDMAAYPPGFFDGFVIGVRAAREAARVEAS